MASLVNFKDSRSMLISEAELLCTIRVTLKCWKVASARRNFG